MPHPNSTEQLRITIATENLSRLCFGLSKTAGWWTDLTTGQLQDRSVGKTFMLMVSELAEAMEGHRKNLKDDHLPEYSMVATELADALIRIFDWLGAQQFLAHELGDKNLLKASFWMIDLLKANTINMENSYITVDKSKNDWKLQEMTRQEIIEYVTILMSYGQSYVKTDRKLLDLFNNKTYDGFAESLLYATSLIAQASELSEINTSLPTFMNCNVNTSNQYLTKAIIVICAIASKFAQDMPNAFADKLYYNTQRADHKIENRQKTGGKQY